MAIIKELDTKFGVQASYHRITAFNISYTRKNIVLCVATYLSKKARQNHSEAIEEIDIEIPQSDFNTFLETNPIERGYLWLKENVVGFEDAADDFEVVDSIFEVETLDNEEPIT